MSTAPSNGRDDTKRLAWWCALVAALIALQYTSRIGSSNAPADPLYHWSFLAASLGQELFFLAVILAIGGFSLRLFALRRPRSLAEAAVVVAAAFVATIVFEIAYQAVVHPGNEQKLTPAHWEPSHAAAYLANGLVVCTLVPLVEELTFRGLGFALLERFGTGRAIAVTGVLFGLSHGLVLELPIIVAFGCLLGFVRARTGSVLPGMVLHGTFNLFALVVAVTIGG
ncbi:MAG: CPBP family intramembrane glutamic endopeptidase [Gaiellaceae bacterium]